VRGNKLTRALKRLLVNQGPNDGIVSGELQRKKQRKRTDSLKIGSISKAVRGRVHH
jgi:hypothetical protein